jgi:hypothetical protein
VRPAARLDAATTLRQPVGIALTTADAATPYPLIGPFQTFTCKLNGVDPHAYLTDGFCCVERGSMPR